MWPEQKEKVVGGERSEKEVSAVETGQAGFLLSEMGRPEGLEQRGMECDLEYETVSILAVKLRRHGGGGKGRGGHCSGLRKQSVSHSFSPRMILQPPLVGWWTNGHPPVRRSASLRKCAA